MERCSGMLLVHVDGSLAACTEELEGRTCAGPEASHRDSSVSCHDVLGLGGCELCSPEHWGDRDWHHTARIGHMVQHRHRCRTHIRRRVIAVVELQPGDLVVASTGCFPSARKYHYAR